MVRLDGQRILVTGSSGFIGRRLVALVQARGGTVIECDVDQDVMSLDWLATIEADAALHAAAHKHAGMGEQHPAEVAELNIVGTHNVVRAVPKVVLASTCKAANPITAYGASKLIAERDVLNAGGTVVRLVNVLGSTGSVTEIWDQVPAREPLPVTDTHRMFMEPDEAARLLVRALTLPSGRYAPDGRELITMLELARRLHPGRPVRPVPLRNGDRPVERLLNDYEHTIAAGDGVLRIVDCWEHYPALEVAA